ncbi:MAG: PilZ domain-containing protein, partial [Candidatus Latescibacteria bacterium]|nr:PilZ domain-containing protein [Candidatus Latescibacterota bacterium]
MGQDKRRHQRLMVNLPVQAQLGSGDVQSLDVVDISPSGMQIRSSDFETLKRGFDAQQNHAEFGIQILARMAWVQNNVDGDYLTGWEFVLGDSGGNRGLADEEPEPETENRRHSRLQIELAVQAHVGSGKYENVEVVDISPSGMQIRCTDFDMLKEGLDVHTNRAQFSILLEARLAWVQ